MYENHKIFMAKLDDMSEDVKWMKDLLFVKYGSEDVPPPRNNSHNPTLRDLADAAATPAKEATSGTATQDVSKDQDVADDKEENDDINEADASFSPFR